jgi:hypothetical protein
MCCFRCFKILNLIFKQFYGIQILRYLFFEWETEVQSWGQVLAQACTLNEHLNWNLNPSSLAFKRFPNINHFVNFLFVLLTTGVEGWKGVSSWRESE